MIVEFLFSGGICISSIYFTNNSSIIFYVLRVKAWIRHSPGIEGRWLKQIFHSIFLGIKLCSFCSQTYQEISKFMWLNNVEICISELSSIHRSNIRACQGALGQMLLLDLLLHFLSVNFPRNSFLEYVPHLEVKILPAVIEVLTYLTCAGLFFVI